MRRVPFHSQEARALANRGPAWREHPSYYAPDPPGDECDGQGPIRHAAGECPWCDQAMLDEHIERQVAASRESQT